MILKTNSSGEHCVDAASIRDKGVMMIATVQECRRTCIAIHRCALMGYKNVIGYIAKMQRIYLICAIVVYRDAAYLCKEHGLRETRLEQVGYVIV